ncbi:copper resistance CopC family protein [Marisediminicola senii]|uniref:copper resistance CopC family protein n=1 Tax=Marisediminicola senii TaxID=2711233 RepID=UPI0013EC503B|nr:copper resistance CopC family protein [Marisediminicola senii]
MPLSHRIRFPSFVAISAGALLAVGMGVGVASPAQAHNYLVSSTPAADSVLTELPPEFSITTNDALLAAGDGAGAFALQVVDGAGAHFEDGCVAVDGPSMSAAIPALGAPGAYTMIWQVVSADGHTISEELPFTWQPADASGAVAGFAEAPVCGEAAPGASPSASPSASPTDDAAPSASPSASSGTEAGTDTGSTDGTEAGTIDVDTASSDTAADSTALWIGGAVLAVAAAVGVTVLVMRRKRTGATGSGTPTE